VYFFPLKLIYIVINQDNILQEFQRGLKTWAAKAQVVMPTRTRTITKMIEKRKDRSLQNVFSQHFCILTFLNQDIFTGVLFSKCFYFYFNQVSFCLKQEKI